MPLDTAPASMNPRAHARAGPVSRGPSTELHTQNHTVVSKEFLFFN